MSKRPVYYQYVTDAEDREITQLLQSLVGPNAKSIAHKIGCHYQDMLNRITNQPRSPRKLELVLRILDVVENPEPFIRWINLRYGFIPPTRVPKIELIEGSLLRHATLASKELGDVSRELVHALEDDLIDMDELRALNKEIMDLVQVSYQLDLAIKHECNLLGD